MASDSFGRLVSIEKQNDEVHQYPGASSLRIGKVDPTEKVEIGLQDLLLIYKTLSEFNWFFHQPEHY
jgi:hypothetical protein